MAEKNKGINNTLYKAREKAKEEIELKKALEALLTADLIMFYQQLADDFNTVYSATGEILNLNESYIDELKALLKKNYRRVGNHFGRSTRQSIEDIVDLDVYEIIPEVAKSLDNRIGMVLGAFFLLRSDDIAPKIANTVRDEMIQRTQTAILQAVEKAKEAGVAPVINNAEIAGTVGEQLKLWGENHAPTVSVTEVQAVAEESKYTEQAEIIKDTAESDDNEYDITELQAGAEKLWITAGDEKVRESHQAIDATLIPADSLFTTGAGSLMRYCGDMSLGAPLSDVINCRCETIFRYNAEVTMIITNHIFRRKGIA